MGLLFLCKPLFGLVRVSTAVCVCLALERDDSDFRRSSANLSSRDFRIGSAELSSLVFFVMARFNSSHRVLKSVPIGGINNLSNRGFIDSIIFLASGCFDKTWSLSWHCRTSLFAPLPLFAYQLNHSSLCILDVGLEKGVKEQHVDSHVYVLFGACCA